MFFLLPQHNGLNLMNIDVILCIIWYEYKRFRTEKIN